MHSSRCTIIKWLLQYYYCYYYYYYYYFPPPDGDIACMCEGCIGGVFVQYVTVSAVSAICIATAGGCWHFELAQPFQFYPTRDRS